MPIMAIKEDPGRLSFTSRPHVDPNTDISIGLGLVDVTEDKFRDNCGNAERFGFGLVVIGSGSKQCRAETFRQKLGRGGGEREVLTLSSHLGGISRSCTAIFTVVTKSFGRFFEVVCANGS